MPAAEERPPPPPPPPPPPSNETHLPAHLTTHPYTLAGDFVKLLSRLLSKKGLSLPIACLGNGQINSLGDTSDGDEQDGARPPPTAPLAIAHALLEQARALSPARELFTLLSSISLPRRAHEQKKNVQAHPSGPPLRQPARASPEPTPPQPALLS